MLLPKLAYSSFSSSLPDCFSTEMDSTSPLTSCGGEHDLSAMTRQACEACQNSMSTRPTTLMSFLSTPGTSALTWIDLSVCRHITQGSGA